MPDYNQFYQQVASAAPDLAAQLDPNNQVQMELWMRFDKLSPEQDQALRDCFLADPVALEGFIQLCPELAQAFSQDGPQEEGAEGGQDSAEEEMPEQRGLGAMFQNQDGGQ